MSLEVIDKGRDSQTRPFPVLFVHGAWNAAWCWDEHFLDFFADKGYRAVALSLRGHGNSTAPGGLHACTISDYVDDVRTVAKTLPVAPVLIGHSMGGLVVQKYLERHAAPAAVLMASMPPQGALGSGLRWMKRHPWHFTKMAITGRSLAYVNTVALARERFFCAHTPDAVVSNYAARLREESGLTGISSIVNRARPGRVTTTPLVLGAGEDGATSAAEVHATARAYRTDPQFFPGMGHAMMMEPGWAAVAGRIHHWLITRRLSRV